MDVLEFLSKLTAEHALLAVMAAMLYLVLNWWREDTRLTRDALDRMSQVVQRLTTVIEIRLGSRHDE